jgi:hypothetical protein
MKTTKTIYLLAAMLGLQFNVLFAAVNYSDASAAISGRTTELGTASLAPSTPAEATFEEVAEPAISLAGLAPVSPAEAEFNDEAPAIETRESRLAPVTPKEADFEEPDGTVDSVPMIGLAPVTPATAEFE